MRGQTKFIDELPEWVRLVKPDAKLSAAEVAQLLGLNTPAFDWRVRAGLFPEADICSERMNSSWRYRRYWKLSSVRRFVARQELSN